MSIQIYNTLTRKKEPFEPLEQGKVKMYVCGPTVYNYIHIGNARPAIVFDTVRRFFEYRGYDVHFVSNFTDVDDKLINAAKELNTDVSTIAEQFIQAYFEDVGALGVKKADAHPRVTECIPEIISFIEVLIKKGYAYEVEGDVYFRTRKFDDYGKLSQQSIDELQAGSRINVGDKKEDALDFALWKAEKEDEISWDSPWGKGRPGWHIECSAMIHKHLGETIDIHAGGHDLTFPHHENEIAQSEAMTGKTFARYWMHNGYININNEKMSKSLGNFILVHDIIKQYSPQVIRFFMLSVHYRHPINFSEELIQSAQNGFERIQTAIQNIQHRLEKSVNLGEKDDEWLATIGQYRTQFIEEMSDDFNTANAITILFELAKEANKYLQESNTTEKVLTSFLQIFNEILTVLGIQIEEKEALLDEEIEELIKKRNEARKNRDFQLADDIRDELKEQGIILEDTAQGVRWRRG
ncbi:MAG TPA: cysteine--tRNA ligase [Massilibacterium sp.]|nr:cysteine--tRNA ligase [Massilibacterium sp.]